MGLAAIELSADAADAHGEGCLANRYYVGSGDGDISWITEFGPFILQYGTDGVLDKATARAVIPKARLWVRTHSCQCQCIVANSVQHSSSI